MSANPIVYIVDDDEASASSIEALLGSHGFRSEIHHSAEAFLDAYDGTRPGCLVLDVRLDGMSGLDLQRRLTATERELPTIIISGHADERWGNEAKVNGAIAFLEKPFRGKTLCELVRGTLRSS